MKNKGNTTKYPNAFQNLTTTRTDEKCIFKFVKIKKDATLKKNVCNKLLNDTCIECSTVMHHMLLVSFKHVHEYIKTIHMVHY